MQRDPQVRACLTTKRLSVLSESAEVHPADDSTAAKQTAATVEEAINAIPGGVPGLVSGALDALAMGFALGELVWGTDGHLECVKWHDPRRFRFESDDWGNLTGARVLDAGMVLDRSRFVLYSYQSRYGNPYGEPDLLAAYRPWVSKDLVQRMWLSALDRFGAPIPVARVPTSWSQSEVNALSALLAKLQNESALVLTNDVEIDVTLDAGRVEPARAFATAAEWLDTQIARAILGQELTTQGSSGGGGSYALGKVHQDTLTDWIQAIRSEIAEVLLSGQVAKVICETMHGPGAPVPSVRFPNLSAADLQARKELVEAMVSGGVIAPAESWIRQYLGLPAQEAAA
jgi:phage gp29-like protein